MTEDEMVGCHHQLDGHEIKQAPGNGEGPTSLVCCSPWGRRVGHDLVTKQQHVESQCCVLCIYFSNNFHYSLS